MADRRTISELKESDAVGQVIAGGINRYVVIKTTDSGVNVVCLYGTVTGDPDEVLEVPDDQEVFVEDREHWKDEFATRWQEIAQNYPAIN